MQKKANASPGYGKHSFQSTVFRQLAEALSGSITEKGRELATRLGGEDQLVREALGLLDISDSQAIDYLVMIYGVTAGSAKVSEAIKEEMEQETAQLQATIRNVFGA